MKMQVRILLVAGAFAFAGNLFAQQDGADPVALVTETTGRIFTELDQNFERYEADPAALEALVRKDLMPLLDVHYSARLILGRAGRGLTKEKVDEFAEAMINLLVSRYAKGLLLFSSHEPLRVLPQRGELNEKLTKVRTRVKLPNGGEAPIDYAFHKTADGWQAFDVIVEGISYVTTFRNQIMPEVRANGIDSVIARLKGGDLELAD